MNRLTVFFALFLLTLGGASASTRCEQPAHGGNTIPFDAERRFVAECAPEVLYSWQSNDSVSNWARRSSAQVILPIDYLYAWRTPIGTFAYGDTLVRIRLKVGVPFIFLESNERRDCSSLRGRYGDSVFVRRLNSANASEYLLCSSNVVQSWSFNEPETVREAKKEIDWIEKNRLKRPREWDSFGRFADGSPKIPWEDESIDSGRYGNDGWHRSGLDERLRRMESCGSFHGLFSLDLANTQESAREDHFRFSRSPIYLKP